MLEMKLSPTISCSIYNNILISCGFGFNHMILNLEDGVSSGDALMQLLYLFEFNTNVVASAE